MPEGEGMSLEISGPFADQLGDGPNLIERAWEAMHDCVGGEGHTSFQLAKNLPVASGIGGGSADAAAALRLLTALWRVEPDHAVALAPELGSDVPACLLSLTSRGTDAGDALELVDADVAGAPVLLVNPRVPLSTGEVFAAWDGVDRGPLGDWRTGRNDLEPPARNLVPAIGEVLEWLGNQEGVTLARMSGSGATCFALLADEASRDRTARACPAQWWHLATSLR
jgi:4-diphosphocytidyl-2-C-methyl-D-erythritol kinase